MPGPLARARLDDSAIRRAPLLERARMPSTLFRLPSVVLAAWLAALTALPARGQTGAPHAGFPAVSGIT